ncbi:hypothetical protein CIK05_09975 [Bdellovibrio sp. qaytius]|nr:hypothetical protein CIK05_09975 [Bdellovibrio sp. qaytius]
MKILSTVLVLMTLWACQQKPTKVLDESANVFEKKAVLIDTRNPFEYESFHIEGSQNLWSEDFLVLTNPKKKTRMLDPDLAQTVERLASRGIHPDKTIILINDKADAIENKKWKWLLSYLEIENIEVKSLNDFKKSAKGQNNRFAKPEAQKPWKLLTSEDFQKDLVAKKAPHCFIKWEAKVCL